MANRAIREIREADPSERLAGLALAIWVLNYVGEAVHLKSGHEGLFSLSSAVDMTLMLASLVLWLRSSRQKLQKLDALSSRVEEIMVEFDKIDFASRYGTGLAHLVDLLRLKAPVHGQAGGETVGDVLMRVYVRAAEDFHNLTLGDKDTVHFEEYHLVDKFLLNLMGALPAGSIWLGVTRLQSAEAWTQGSAEESYYRFQELVQRRTSSGQIEYYRLWCFDDEARQRDMEPVLRSQTAAKIIARSCVAKDIPDMSLIWVPRNPAVQAKPSDDAGQLFTRLRGNDYDPLCGIEFDPRGGKELDSMTLYSPKADRFDALRYKFEQHWKPAAQTTLA